MPKRRADPSSEEPEAKKPAQEANVYPTNKTMPSSYTIPQLDAKQVKIMSWNVGGMMASMKKGFSEYIKAEQATIVCLQETKLNETPLKSFISESVYPFQYVIYYTLHHCQVLTVN